MTTREGHEKSVHSDHTDAHVQNIRGLVAGTAGDELSEWADRCTGTFDEWDILRCLQSVRAGERRCGDLGGNEESCLVDDRISAHSYITLWT